MSPRRINVTNAELEIIQILWQHGPLTAKEVLEQLPTHKNTAYSTVITLLQRMEAKGAVKHTKSDYGKAFIFHPVLKPEQVRKRALREVVKQHFQNNPVPVFATLVENRKLSDQELRQLREILKSAESRKETKQS